MAKYRVRHALVSLISLSGVLGAMLLVGGAVESAASDLSATAATETLLVPPTRDPVPHRRRVPEFADKLNCAARSLDRALQPSDAGSTRCRFNYSPVRTTLARASAQRKARNT